MFFSIFFVIFSQSFWMEENSSFFFKELSELIVLMFAQGIGLVRQCKKEAGRIEEP